MGEQKNNGAYFRGTNNARVIQVIQTVSLRGAGTPEEPFREVVQYWSFEGKMIGEEDPEKEWVAKEVTP